VSLIANCARAAEGFEAYVDPIRGNDNNSGTKSSPLKTVSAAIEKVPELVAAAISVHLAPGVYKTTGAKGMPASLLILDRKMRREGDNRIDISVHIIGEGRNFEGAAKPGEVILDWGTGLQIQVDNGIWNLENVQIGNRSYKGTQQGIIVSGSSSLVHLRNVRIRTTSLSGCGIGAIRGGEVQLHGRIELNEDLHDQAPENSFCGISASYNGTVRWNDSSGVLSMGNGSLSAGYFGVIELGCKTARITSWGRQSNNLAINDSGRIDLHGTETTLCSKHKENTLIGLEDDGHILAEGAKIILETEPDFPGYIVLQKASTLYVGTFIIHGNSGVNFSASSGSSLMGAVEGKVGQVGAETGSYIALWCSQKPESINESKHGMVDIQVAPAVGR
jgi:hypothetical protein